MLELAIGIFVWLLGVGSMTLFVVGLGIWIFVPLGLAAPWAVLYYAVMRRRIGQA